MLRSVSLFVGLFTFSSDSLVGLAPVSHSCAYLFGIAEHSRERGSAPTDWVGPNRSGGSPIDESSFWLEVIPIVLSAALIGAGLRQRERSVDWGPRSRTVVWGVDGTY